MISLQPHGGPAVKLVVAYTGLVHSNQEREEKRLFEYGASILYLHVNM